MIAVSTKPSIIAIKGLFNEENMFMTKGDSFSPAIAPDMVERPINSTPNPMITSPNFDSFGFLLNITKSTPDSKIIGANFSSLKDTKSAVTVVPILEPKITPAAWYSVISPAFTKLTTIAVQAEED